MNINTAVSLAYNDTVGLLSKLVRQYIESGELRDRFDIFDKDAVPYGVGFEIDVILAASKNNDGTNKANEHGNYSPTTIALHFNTVTGGQYAVTLDDRRVRECVGNAEKAQEYAAELTQSLYQGWIDDKNTAVAAECEKLIGKAEQSKVEVTLDEANVDKFALDVLTQIKAKVEDIREGITGTSYGNTNVGTKRIAARNVVIVMSNALAATLDTHGYAKVFGSDYVRTAGVQRITSSRIKENTVLVTDSRNIQVREKFESFEEFRNSDSSVNFFLNKYQYIEAAISKDIVGFPFVVITTSEAV